LRLRSAILATAGCQILVPCAHPINGAYQPRSLIGHPSRVRSSRTASHAAREMTNGDKEARGARTKDSGTHEKATQGTRKRHTEADKETNNRSRARAASRPAPRCPAPCRRRSARCARATGAPRSVHESNRNQQHK
jgi:hypothetical protein